MIITYKNKTHINLKLCTFSMKNPEKTSTVIKNIRGSVLYQRQSGRGGGHSMWR
jgi:GTP cyclohydrolase II